MPYNKEQSRQLAIDKGLSQWCGDRLEGCFFCRNCPFITGIFFVFF